ALDHRQAGRRLAGDMVAGRCRGEPSDRSGGARAGAGRADAAAGGRRRRARLMSGADMDAAGSRAPTWPTLICPLTQGESLTADSAAWAMNEIMEGAATPTQIAGFGVALRIKGETADEVGGMAAAMLAHAAPLSIPGRLTDLVGTGGDRAHT